MTFMYSQLACVHGFSASVQHLKNYLWIYIAQSAADNEEKRGNGAQMWERDRKRQGEATKWLRQTNIDFLSALHCNCTDMDHLFGV